MGDCGILAAMTPATDSPPPQPGSDKRSGVHNDNKIYAIQHSNDFD
jgi:hypothetical protein